MTTKEQKRKINTLVLIWGGLTIIILILCLITLTEAQPVSQLQTKLPDPASLTIAELTNALNDNFYIAWFVANQTGLQYLLNISTSQALFSPYSATSPAQASNISIIFNLGPIHTVNIFNITEYTIMLAFTNPIYNTQIYGIIGRYYLSYDLSTWYMFSAQTNTTNLFFDIIISRSFFNNFNNYPLK